MSKKITKEVYEKRQKRLNILKLIFIIFDLFSICFFIFKLLSSKQVFYSPFIPLILGNIMVFISKPDSI